ncbi:unnamed protein product, partial [Sphacelaria rigidula]
EAKSEPEVTADVVEVEEAEETKANMLTVATGQQDLGAAPVGVHDPVQNSLPSDVTEETLGDGTVLDAHDTDREPGEATDTSAPERDLLANIIYSEHPEHEGGQDVERTHVSGSDCIDNGGGTSEVPTVQALDMVGPEEMENVEPTVTAQASAPSMNELVIFVGSGTASHLATLQSTSTTEFVDLRRSSCVSLQVPDSESKTTDEEHTVDSCRDEDRETGWLKALENCVGANETIDLAVLGATMGTIPGGVSVLCLAHDSMMEDDGESRGLLVRAEVLTSAAEALVKARRRMRAAMVSTTVLATQSDDAVVPGIGGAAIDGASLGSSTTEAGVDLVHISAVAAVEVSVEMDVLGGELCADLSNIFGSLGGTGSRHFMSMNVYQALRKHEALLSPATISALTALLSAHGQSAVWGNEDVGSGAPINTDWAELSVGDSKAWDSVVEDALMTVRTASLEHAVMWAASCDLDRVESACKSRAGLSVAAGSSCGVVEQRGHDTLEEVAWEELHRVSGLGLSPLLLTAATLSDNAKMTWTNSCNDDNESKSIGDDACDEVDRSHSTVRSLMRLLSVPSLKTIARYLSLECTTETTGPGNASGEGVNPKRRQEKIQLCVPGSPAIEDLSVSDGETLT